MIEPMHPLRLFILRAAVWLLNWSLRLAWWQDVKVVVTSQGYVKIHRYDLLGQRIQTIDWCGLFFD